MAAVISVKKIENVRTSFITYKTDVFMCLENVMYVKAKNTFGIFGFFN